MHSKPWIIIDLETTGLHPQKGDVIIDIAAIKGDETGITDTFQSFVHPGNKEVSPFVQVLTGITMESLRNAPSDTEALSAFKTFLGDTDYTIIGHNISFDVGFLRHYGITLDSSAMLDTNDFATLFFPDAGSHSLEILADLLQVEHTAKHTALGDVHATYELLRAMLSTYKDNFEKDYSKWLPELLNKIPLWGGKQFFHMSLPSRSYVTNTSASTQTGTPYAFEDLSSDTLYIIPQYSEREDTLLSLSEQQSAVLLTSNVHISPLRKRALASKKTLYLDSPSSFLSQESIQQFLDKEQFEEHEALFAIRAHTLQRSSTFIHVSSLPLTYRERGIIAQFTVNLDTQYQEFVQFLQSHTTIVTTYHHYFFGVLASSLQAKSNIVISSSAELLPDIIKSARTILDEDSYSWKTQRLKAIFQQSDSFSSTGALRDIDSLDHVVKYFFQYVEKECKKNTSRIPRESFQTYIQPFVASIEKASRVLKEATLDLERQSQEYAVSLLDKLLGETYEFLQDESDDFLITAENYTNRGHIIKEYALPEELLAIITEKNTVYTDTRYMPRYPYPLPFKDTTLLGESLHIDDRNVHIKVAPTNQHEKAEYLASALHLEQKSVILMSSATKCERIFDYMYEELSSKKYIVLGQGKSGGKGKIAHLFQNSEAGVLIQRVMDIDINKLPTELAQVLLTVIPFYIAQGQYFERIYAKKSFGTLTLPLTFKSIADLLDGFERKHQPVTITLLDERFASKGYGQEIIAELATLFPTEY